MKNKGTLFMVQAAAIAAVYVVLTTVFAAFSFGEVQVRISEAMTILPVFTPAAIPGLFVGCLISNFLGGAILLDVIFGSIATLIGAVFTWKCHDCAIYTILWIWCESSDSVYDADRWHWRGNLLWRSWNGTLWSIK